MNIANLEKIRNRENKGKEDMGPVYFEVMHKISAEIHAKIEDYVEKFEHIGEFKRYI